MNKKLNPLIIATGLLVGIAAVVLTAAGNPGNMGFCIACFIRDIAGGLKLHSAAKVQYIRPEIIGIVAGAFIMALVKGEWKAKGGSSPFTRFMLGSIVMIGALAFLGCPLRMVIRLGGGDFNALVGLAGFVAGILVGVAFLKKGFSLRRSYALSAVEGAAFPAALVLLLVLSLAAAAKFAASTEGPGSMHAAWYLSFAIALVAGAVAQRSRFCMAGGIRDAVMFRDFNLLSGFIALFIAVLAGNLIRGTFVLGFTGQKIAHNAHVWNFLGMVLVGWGSALLGGCPLRQLILAGEGSSDSAVTVLGMLFGAAISHNFGWAGNAGDVTAGGGVAPAGRIAIIVCLVILALVSVFNARKEEK